MLVDEVQAELDLLAVAEVAPGLAAMALKLAEALDALEARDAPTAQAVLADKLHALMVRLRALAPIQEQGDAVDEFTREREARRAEVRKLHG
ncbi:hypothetical protein [Streptomyces sp. WAC01280]|uniref:hypothetical protein n=1 Tax=Streptomyces sp. WAC01280 TaxID=2487424 RepID=UPI000F7A6124|nr:hypothetical protein [Streptomyces sp. WAC01280]RSS59794.1 hypothetical protein EF909_08005 [Streptomyces sp. WAC01280]